MCGAMFAGVAPPARAALPVVSEGGVASMSEVITRALGAQSGARSPSYPLVHPSSMLE